MNYGAPVMLNGLAELDEASALVPIDGRPVHGEQPKYKEKLLQTLVQRFPQCLPVYEVEPAFNDLRSVCTELPLGWEGQSIYVDNLLANPDGKLCLVECKLWRNGESSREVVAQIINYATALSGLTYDELSGRVAQALQSKSANALATAVLDDVSDPDAIGRFEKGVERSLRTGAFLLLIVGDRIQPGISRMTELLQLRPTVGFAIGLVEMPIFSAGEPAGPFIVLPRLVGRTETVTRTVFVGRAADGKAKIEDVQAATSAPTSLSEAEFYDALAAVQPDLVSGLRDLLQRCVNDHGCTLRLLRRYNVYVEDGRGGEITVATFSKDGTVEFWTNSAKDRFLGQPLVQAYVDRVAKALPGGRSRDDSGHPFLNVRINGRTAIPLSLVLEHQTAWLGAVDALSADLEPSK